MNHLPAPWRRLVDGPRGASRDRGLRTRLGAPYGGATPFEADEVRRAWRPDSNRFVRDAGLARLEAALLWADEPLTPQRLVKLTGLPDTGEVRRQVERLSAMLRADRSAFYVHEIAGGYQLLTRPDLRKWIDRICRVQMDSPLSAPMLETLAIVAYRQPICRADVEAIRGVQVGEILRCLMDRGLVRLAGKEETLGRPYLYATTKKFLQTFGLRHLHELPMAESLAAPAATDSA